MPAITLFVAFLALPLDPTIAIGQGSSESMFQPMEFVLNDRDFNIPYRVNPNRAKEIAKLRLYVSTDKGKEWRRVQTVNTEKTKDGNFEFHASADGDYWFALQTISKDGMREPKKMMLGEAGLRVMKVEVQTSAKPSDIQSKDDPQRDNLAELSTKLGVAEQRLTRLENEKKQKAQEIDAKISELRSRLEKVEKRLAELERGSTRRKK
jgi:hypothetical protein